VPLAAAAFVPSTPLLVPEIAGGAAAGLHDARTACDTAVSGLWAADPDLVAVVAAGERTGEVPPPYRGSFAPWGVPIDVTLSVGEPGQDHDRLSPAALVGVWLLARHAPAGPVRLWTVDPAAAPADCAALGRAITAGRRVAMLVLGEGAARHAADPRAESFDAAVLEALVDVDTARLLELDPGLAGTLRATGRAPLQVLAGAAGGAGGTAGQKLRSNVRYAAKPYGVGYFVASWQ
jgi:hypothetical protein